MRLPQLTASAKAQAWGMAVGFALALLATYRLGFGLAPFFLGWLGAWIGWELTLGLRIAAANAHRTDVSALAYALIAGFAFPWAGFALAALLNYLRP
jgi:hypothetical protein